MMIEIIYNVYMPFAQALFSTYRYLREERHEFRLSGKIASLNLELDELLQKPSRATLLDALNSTEYIMRLLDQLHESGYLIDGLYKSAHNAGKALVTFLTERVTYKPEPVAQETFVQESNEDSKSCLDLYESVRNLAIKEGRISASMIQRYLHVGYMKANNLLAALEKNGIIETDNKTTMHKCLIK